MMAQRIQTVCDVHLERGEDVDAETWEVQVRRAGTRTAMREVDLCGECSTVLAQVAAFAAEHGRTVAQSPVKAARAKVAASEGGTVAAPPVGADGTVTCPVDGCGTSVLSSNLARHVRTHGLTLEPRRGKVRKAGEGGEVGEFPCPDCDRTFTRAQGLGAHRYQAHGYESPTRAARVERAAS